MRFLRKSILRKFLLAVLIAGGFLSLMAWFFSGKGAELLGWEFFVGSLSVVVLIAVLFYYFEIIRPLKKILAEVQCLLTGKKYKKVYTGRVDELGVIAYFFNKVTESLGEISFDIKDRQRMISELNTASQLQGDILPANSTPDVKGLIVVAKSKPATELGGDSFNFFSLKGKTYIYIGDVTGHGVAAGLIMTMANSLIAVFADLKDSAYEILVNVNRYIKRHVKKAMFMTLVMLSWDEDKEEMSFVGAGHEHILVYRADSGQCEVIMSGGVALGMVPDNSAVIKEQKLPLADGDMIVLYSDGITEAKNKEGELFGLERLKALVVEYCAEYSPEGVHHRIAKTVSEYMEGHGQDDDITLIVIKKDSNLSKNVKD